MSGSTSVEGARPAQQTLRVGRWQVDASADEIAADGKVLKLEPLQMRLLLALAAQPGQVVTTQALLDEVWRNLVVTPNSVYQAVAQLRRQLGDAADGPTYIQTVHRKGYRLLAPVSVEDATDPRRAAPAAPAEPSVAKVPSAEVDVDADAIVPAPAPAPATQTPALPAAPPSRRRRRLALSALGAVAAVGVGAAWWGQLDRPSPAIRRLAVLPFADRTAGGAERALARGLAQDVARWLGRRGELVVLAPDALTEIDTAAEVEPLRLAQRLDVQAWVAGELERSGARLRVSARLLSASRGGELVWQQVFEHSVEQAGQLPAVMAQQIAAALALAPLPAPAADPGTVSQAYELYVLGSDALVAKTPEAFVKARGYFQRGIDADPAYARNYVGLGWTWIGQGSAGSGLDLPRAVALATPLFERALRLDPDVPEALTGMATLHQFAGESDRARELLQRALALQPSYAQAQMSLGVVEFESGWPLRAVPLFERAAALKPMSASPVERLALAQTFAGRIDAALLSAGNAIAREPDYPNGYWMLGVAGYAGGDLARAVEGYRQALQRDPRRPYLWYDLARLYLDLGRADEAAAAFARCVEQLPGVAWPTLHAAWAWLVREPRPGTVPAALDRRPADGSVAEWALMRAMAGLPLDFPAVQRALDSAQAQGAAPTAPPWFVFQGSHRVLDLATAKFVLGQRLQAEQNLDAVAAQLDTLERQGNRFHALAFHRSRVLALRGQVQPAIAALEAAVAAGHRRGWWLRLDPAFAGLRGEPRFAALLGRIEELVAGQRRQLGL